MVDQTGVIVGAGAHGSFDIRAELESLIERDLLGSWDGPEEELPPGEVPAERYLLGRLVPATPSEQPETEAAGAEANSAVGTTTLEEDPDLVDREDPDLVDREVASSSSGRQRCSARANSCGEKNSPPVTPAGGRRRSESGCGWGARSRPISLRSPSARSKNARAPSTALVALSSYPLFGCPWCGSKLAADNLRTDQARRRTLVYLQGSIQTLVNEQN